MNRATLRAFLDQLHRAGCRTALGPEDLLIRPGYEEELHPFEIRLNLTQRDPFNGAVVVIDDGPELTLPEGISSWDEMLARASLIFSVWYLQVLSRQTVAELQRANRVQTVMECRELVSKLSDFCRYGLDVAPFFLGRAALADPGTRSRW